MTDTPPRRTISEILALHYLEPDLIDIFVEGSTDRLLLEYFLSDTKVKVFEINRVDVPDALVASHGFTSGARQRVITLAAALERGTQASQSNLSIRCIIDSDFYWLLNERLPPSRYLILTDYSCLESYWYSHNHLGKYIKVGLHSPAALRGIDIASELFPTLQELFLLRAAKSSLNLDWQWLDPTRCCEQKDGKILFNRTAFLDRFLNKNNAFHFKQNFLIEIERLRPLISIEPSKCINGHDFVDLLAWYIKPHVSVKELSHKEVVARMLACSAEKDVLVLHPLFAALATISGMHP
ncbi:hypothetical protein ABZ260_24500 [Streptosporangium sp. NPDC006013]|uniref:hypothetical protein n=1 Tax=Streptosporangium sp. NPDC006013 TaxID=3155596 RepID=UPI0033A64BF1